MLGGVKYNHKGVNTMKELTVKLTDTEIASIIEMVSERKRFFANQLKKNPPINEKMIRAMMTQMGRTPSEKQVRAVMKSMEENK